MGKKKAQEFYSAIDEIIDKEAFLESVREGFSEIEDPRAQDNQSYRLIDIMINKRQRVDHKIVQSRDLPLTRIIDF